MNNRARPLLDLAHMLNECKNCDRWQEHGLNPCHESGISAGKGQSIKSQDNRTFAGCNACHDWYDGRSSAPLDPSGLYPATKEGRAELFNRAHKRTFDEYWRRGWLKVCA